MKKKLEIIDSNLMEEFLSIFSIGLLECMKAEVINPTRAEQWLFSPVIACSSQLKCYSKPFRFAMEFASEMEASSHFDCYMSSLNKNVTLFLNCIKKMKQLDYDGEYFIEGIVNLKQ